MVSRASLAICRALLRSPEVAEMKILGGFMTREDDGGSQNVE